MVQSAAKETSVLPSETRLARMVSVAIRDWSSVALFS